MSTSTVVQVEGLMQACCVHGIGTAMKFVSVLSHRYAIYLPLEQHNSLSQAGLQVKELTESQLGLYCHQLAALQQYALQLHTCEPVLWSYTDLADNPPLLCSYTAQKGQAY